MRLLPLGLALCLATLPTFYGVVAQPKPQHQDMNTMATPGADGAQAALLAANGSGQALMASMEKMNQAMSAVPMMGDTDQDFVAMMIPHHQGAVDMCAVEVRDGRIPSSGSSAMASLPARPRRLRC